MNLLKIEDIYAMHREATDNFGGEDGVFKDTDAKLQSILDQQYSHFGYDKYSTIFQKSAMLGYFLAKDHCFRDGNKRVALYSIYALLYINNYELMLTNEEAENMILKISVSNVRGVQVDEYINDIADYIQEHSSLITE